jgi:hypothetical protein
MVEISGECLESETRRPADHGRDSVVDEVGTVVVVVGVVVVVDSVVVVVG